MTAKKKLLIFYDWFYPGFKAGGPIQSLTNLAVSLASEFDIFIITSAYDLNSAIPYEGIVVNAWNGVLLPDRNSSISVYYAMKKTLTAVKIQTLLKDVSPSIVYLNGIFSYHFFLLPLLSLKKTKGKIKVVICPRGMLKKGALSGKAFKKKIYIGYLKHSGLLRNVYWQATTKEEQADIYTYFPASKGIGIAPNIPKQPLKTVSAITKEPGRLRLVYLSLVNEHKNLLLLLEIIKHVKPAVSLDIYGPVVDERYWKNCQDKITEMSDRVRYAGTCDPAAVQKVLAEYDTLILLTKGENFGHAIYESLSVGRPVITSPFTPWQNLKVQKAGAIVDLESRDDIFSAINYFAEMNQSEYSSFCVGAHVMATDYYSKVDAKQSYKQLFMWEVL
ncbi:MAG: glycosyltransferase [Bacteroidota bacterium]|nr:glycosyltransferase [Bacteroidota bacterium]